MSLETDTPLVLGMFEALARNETRRVFLDEPRNYDVRVPRTGMPWPVGGPDFDRVYVGGVPGAQLRLFLEDYYVETIFRMRNLRYLEWERVPIALHDRRMGGRCGTVMDLSTVRGVPGYSSRAHFRNLTIECAGLAKRPWGAGLDPDMVDVNNEWHVFEDCGAANYQDEAWRQRGVNAKEIVHVRPTYDGNGGGTVGGIVVEGGTCHVDGQGRGRIGNNRGADIVLLAPRVEPMHFTWWNSENSARLIEVRDDLGAPILIQGVDWASDGLHEDGNAIVHRGTGPLTIEHSAIGGGQQWRAGGADADGADAGGGYNVPHILIGQQDAIVRVRQSWFGARGSASHDPIRYATHDGKPHRGGLGDWSIEDAWFMLDDYRRTKVPAFEKAPWRPADDSSPVPPVPPGPRPMRDPVRGPMREPRTGIGGLIDAILGRR